MLTAQQPEAVGTEVICASTVYTCLQHKTQPGAHGPFREQYQTQFNLQGTTSLAMCQACQLQVLPNQQCVSTRTLPCHHHASRPSPWFQHAKFYFVICFTEILVGTIDFGQIWGFNIDFLYFPWREIMVSYFKGSLLIERLKEVSMHPTPLSFGLIKEFPFKNGTRTKSILQKSIVSIIANFSSRATFPSFRCWCQNWSCYSRLDLECDALIIEMFHHSLKWMKQYHLQRILSFIYTIMAC